MFPGFMGSLHGPLPRIGTMNQVGARVEQASRLPYFVKTDLASAGLKMGLGPFEPIQADYPAQK